jgi:hypothetical protein
LLTRCLRTGWLRARLLRRCALLGNRENRNRQQTGKRHRANDFGETNWDFRHSGLSGYSLLV